MCLNFLQIQDGSRQTGSTFMSDYEWASNEIPTAIPMLSKITD